MKTPFVNIDLIGHRVPSNQKGDFKGEQK